MFYSLMTRTSLAARTGSIRPASDPVCRPLFRMLLEVPTRLLARWLHRHYNFSCHAIRVRERQFPQVLANQSL